MIRWGALFDWCKSKYTDQKTKRRRSSPWQIWRSKSPRMAFIIRFMETIISLIWSSPKFPAKPLAATAECWKPIWKSIALAYMRGSFSPTSCRIILLKSTPPAMSAWHPSPNEWPMRKASMRNSKQETKWLWLVGWTASGSGQKKKFSMNWSTYKTVPDREYDNFAC